MVQYIYTEATTALTSTVAATITSRGIETPLGVLSAEQVIKGEQVLDRISKLLEVNILNLHQSKIFSKSNPSQEDLEKMSGEFYTLIPHHLGGRSRDQVKKAVISTTQALDQKKELVQLMKDMLQVWLLW